MLAADAIRFPFRREQVFSIGELRRFEKDLLLARQSDLQLSDEWRVPKGEIKRWVKVREETYPLMLFADHKAISDESKFRLAPEGSPSPIDIELWGGSGKKLLQVTTANPERAESVNGGYDHRLAMEELTRRGVLTEFGPFRRKGERIGGTALVADARDDFVACVRGLCTTFSNKKNYDGTGCELLIFARSYFMTAIDFDLTSIVQAAVAEVGKPNFDNIYVFDEKPSWFVEF
ncbi:MAG TPA: hypothetical protein VMH86_04045 [Rhizomicrobium sp.]|nr:hypothetical protein [Rhizomicrobium sp.]